ncbi:thiamine pyrophosphate-dependent dehydrogenase E1 component subunit alpha [Conexibacter sp. CPCC 206217]|uniref:thiamine pyrophosphate-dependent dehydrogenase E1 component subunit alpha n=1 Tax=Conexibacter sp. CPCC 206217 TaxID=3064574 RepID=UPI0027261E59|nr:thiamine pyrophosphate-dependent dehydrogenase E1 component subunit alpha [Conexibacter sp. CPCC 206217]MDO8212413.1 thiamine pyrophosphate-dependent dehydrogenase E1 component subunit alpha [Conexibacter sp. CPCC 206217]
MAEVHTGRAGTIAGTGEARGSAGRYRMMRLSRRFEETVHDQFGDGQVPGPLHLSIGQEAVAVGACWGLRQTDAVLSTHRGHHHCLAKGARADRLMAELLGRTTGYSRGRGGSMHVAIPSIGLLGTNGIVGGGIPIATGAAYGMQAQGRDDVTVCFFGEGATGAGVFGEALNLAALWSLPLVFVCENNQYVELTPQSVHVAGEIWRRGESFGIPGVRVDGNDVDAVHEAASDAIERARGGGGPTLIEAVTYRWFGHYAGDRAAYRDENEVETGRAGDPLIKARAALDPAEAEALDADVEKEISAALAFAQRSAVTGPDALAIDHWAVS